LQMHVKIKFKVKKPAWYFLSCSAYTSVSSDTSLGATGGEERRW
jgi:hypothetical protein